MGHLRRPLYLLTVLVLGVAATSVHAARRPRPTPCSGRFVVPGAPLAGGGGSAGDLIVVGTTVEIAGCPAARAKRKATRKATIVNARWKGCTAFTGRATFSARIAPDCGTIQGTFKAKKAKIKRPFTGVSSACGDGFVDTASEQCDGASGCAASATCNSDCACVQTGGPGGPGGPAGPGGPGGPGGNGVPTARVAGAGPVQAGVAVLLDGTASSDPDGDPLTHAWDFGDGGRGGTARVPHVFAEPGTYTVRLTVADGRGGAGSAETGVTVTPGPVPSGTVDATGTVRALGGTPLAGVSAQVLGGGASATTGADGTVTLPVARGIPVQLHLSKPGFADQSVTLTVPAAAESAIFEATLLPREPALTLADAAAGGMLEGKHGARVELPPGALVDAAGNAVAGPVAVSLTPVNPVENPETFPGRFEGIASDGQPGLLLSYGTVEYVLGAGDVNLRPGIAATIELPAYAGLKKNGAPVMPGDTIPLWSLDERTGVWVQEGVGTMVVSSASPTGLALRGTVTHFSWWNCDDFDGPPYKPKPRCLVDTDHDGKLEDLTGTGYCWHYGTGPEQGGPGTFSGAGLSAGIPAAAPPPRLPNFAAQVMTPAAGGVVLPIPADYDIVLRSTAKGGALAATTILRGPAGVEEDVVVLLEEVDLRPAVPIAVPWDQTYTFDADGEVDSYVVTVAKNAPVFVQVSRVSGAFLTGTLFIEGPGGVTFGPEGFNNNPVLIGFSAPTAGQYTIRVEATGDAPDEYRLEVSSTGPFPLVLSTSPADGAAGVPLNSPVSATFSSPIDPATVNTSSFRVDVGGTSVDGTYQVNGTVVTFTPSQPLSAGSPHTVTLAPQIRSLDGGSLPAPHVFTFTTPDVAGALSIIASGQHPDVVALPNGEALMILERSFDEAVSRYVPGGGWSPPQTLRGQTDPGQGRLLAVPGGDVVAVWYQDDSSQGPSSVYSSRLTAGTWSPATPIETSSTSFNGSSNNGSGDLRSPQLAGDAAGNVIAVWEVGQQGLWWNRYTPGGGWGTAQALVTGDVSGTITHPHLAMNAAGHALLAWHDLPGAGNNELSALVRRYTPGSGWEPAVEIDHGADQVLTVHVALDAAGNGLALYKQGGFYHARRYDAAAGEWDQDAVPLQEDPAGGPGLGSGRQAKLVATPDGGAIALAAAHLGATQLVWTARYTPGPAGSAGTWSAVTPLDTIYPSNGFDLAVNAAGQAVAVWTLPGSTTGLRYKRYTPGVGWAASFGTIEGTASSYRPDVALGPGGQAFVATVREGTGAVVAVRLP